MPISEPNPVSILDPQAISPGAVKQYSNRIRYTGGDSADANLWANVTSALTSAQTQLDHIINALRADLPQSNLLHLLDPNGDPQAAIGDQIGVDDKQYSCIWMAQLFLGGKGPGDPNGVVISIDNTGTIQITKTINFTQPVTVSSLTASGEIDANSFNCTNALNGYKVGGTQVLSSRRTGWATPTGTTSRATFDQSTVTLPQLAQRLAALINDLTTMGIIGT